MDRILVVDDAELNRELLYDILKDNYIIETAEDGAEALEKLRKYRGGISDLLLVGLLVGKMCSGVIDQFRNKMYDKARRLCRHRTDAAKRLDQTHPRTHYQQRTCH